MTSRVILFFLIIGLAVGVSLGLCKWSLPKPEAVSVDDGSPVALGKPAPDFTGTTLDGKTVKLSDLKGKPVLIDFWATWCGPCVESLPHTQELAERSANLGFQVLTVTDDDQGAVSRFMKDNHFSFPVILDKNGDVSKQFVSEGIPTFVILDGKGNIASYIVGSGSNTQIEGALRNVGVKL